MKNYDCAVLATVNRELATDLHHAKQDLEEAKVKQNLLSEKLQGEKRKYILRESKYKSSKQLFLKINTPQNLRY